MNDIVQVPGIFEDPVLKQRFAFISVVVAIFSMLIAPYSGVHLPKTIILLIGFGAMVMLLVFTLHRVDLLVLLLVAYLPFSKELVGDFGGIFTGLNAFNILFVFIFFSLVGRSGKGHQGNFTTPLNLVLVCYCLWALVALIRGGFVMEEGLVTVIFINFKRWISPILLYFLITNAVEDRTLRRDIIITISVGVFFVALLGLKEFYIDKGVSSSWEKSRIVGICGNSNQLGAFFVYYGSFLLAFITSAGVPVLYRLGLVVPVLVSIRALMLTVSRGAFVAFGGALMVVTFVKSKIAFVLLLLGMVFFFSFPQLLPETFTGRFSGIIKEQDVVADGSALVRRMEGSARLRLYALLGGWEMVKESPFFGKGYNLFRYLIQDYVDVGFPLDSHNSYLSIAAEMGIPALIMFLIILGLLVKNTIYVYKYSPDQFIKTAALGFLACLVGVIMANLFGSRLNTLELSGYFWILAGIFMRESKELHQKREESASHNTISDEFEET